MPTKEEKAAARVASIRSAWTPERRKAASEAAKARRAAETPEQLAARKAKRAKTMQANPEIEKKRAENIARTRRLRRDKISKAASEAHAKKSDEAKAASLANLEKRMDADTRAKRAETVKTPKRVRKLRKQKQLEQDLQPRQKTYRMREWTIEERRKASEEAATRWKTMTPAQREIISNKRKEAYAKIRSQLRDSANKFWTRMSPEKRSARIRRMQDGRRLKEYTLVDGSVAKFHSSWEAACADALIRAGVSYRSQVHFVLGKTNYFADFVVELPNGINLIIEVKGYYRAWKRWNTITLPALSTHLKGPWRVYLLDVKLRPNVDTWEKLIDNMVMVAIGRPLKANEQPTMPVTPEQMVKMDMLIV